MRAEGDHTDVLAFAGTKVIFFSPAPNIQTWFPSARTLEQQTIVLVTH